MSEYSYSAFDEMTKLLKTFTCDSQVILRMNYQFLINWIVFPLFLVNKGNQ